MQWEESRARRARAIESKGDETRVRRARGRCGRRRGVGRGIEPGSATAVGRDACKSGVRIRVVDGSGMEEEEEEIVNDVRRSWSGDKEGFEMGAIKENKAKRR